MSFGANLSSRGYTGSKTLAPNQARQYFALYATASDVEVEFGEGGAKIAIGQGGFYEPYIPPISQIEVTGTSFVIVTDRHT